MAYNHSLSSPEVGCLFVLLALGELNQSFRPTDIASPSGRLFSHCLKGLITELAQTDRFAFVSDSPVPRALFPETRGKGFISPALSGPDLERGLGDVRNRVPGFISLTAHYHGNSAVLTSAL